MSKGSTRRAEADHGAYARHFERIFQARSQGNIEPMPTIESVNRQTVYTGNEVTQTEINGSQIRDR